MNAKKKLTSVLSLTLALCMLLSTAAMALDTSAGMSSTDAGSSSHMEPAPSGEPDQSTDGTSSGDADASASTDPGEPAKPVNPAESVDLTDPADTPAEGGDDAEEPGPDVMETTGGWSQTSQDGETVYIYTYLDDGATKQAGKEVAGENYQVLYLPEQHFTVNGESITFEKGYYFFQDGHLATHYSVERKRYKNTPVVTLKDGQYKVTSTDAYCMMSVEDGVGKPYTGYGLGTEKTPNLYYYHNGKYQTNTSKNKLKENDGYTFFEGKLYYATEATLNDKKTSPYASPFTGRRTEDGYSRRYEKGEPYTGYGLGTQKTPNLYYYVDGYYNKDKSASKSMLKSPGTDGYFKYGSKTYYGGDGWYKYDGKWYHTTTDSLENEKTSPYSILANKVYRVYKPDGKLYYYSKGKASLYTGVYKNYYYSKGVKQTHNGWTKLSGKWYYFKKGKAVTGWQYLSRNGNTYKYYFKSDGTLVEDLFTYFGSSYLKKKMIVQVNRTTHTADILLYDSAKKKYCIAASSFICSTCEKSSDFKTGTFSLYSNRRKRWFTFTHPETRKTTYYQYATFIVGTDAWIHSPQYKKKGDIYSLNVGNYNKLGTNQSFYCVRFQTRYSKRVYDAVGKQGSKKVKVKLYRSSNKGPYGQIKLSDSTGKLPKNKPYDPTDPAVKKK